MGESFFKRPETAADDAAQWDRLRAAVSGRDHWVVVTDRRNVGESFAYGVTLGAAAFGDAGQFVTHVKIHLTGTADRIEMWVLCTPKVNVPREWLLAMTSILGVPSGVRDDPAQDMLFACEEANYRRVAAALQAVLDGATAPVRRAAENN